MKLDPAKTILLIDGSSFLYRAYYAIRPLHTPGGEAVQAVYGFCRMIKKLLDKFSPQHMALVWDSKGKTTRHETYPDYKATRQAPPSDLFTQKEYIVEFADDIGLLQVQEKGIEADDIIYSLAEEYKKKDFTIIVITSDKDMGQMIDEKTFLYDPMKDTMFDRAAFAQRMGFPVEKLPFYFALLGDVSDNIPGVRGVGKKGALQLVNKFASLEDVYKNFKDVPKGRLRTALEKGKENAFLSRDLFLLQYHKTGVTQKELAFNVGDWVKARDLFQKLNFKSLLKGMPVGSGDDAKEAMGKYDFRTVATPIDLANMCAQLEKKKVFALDTETDGVDPLVNECVGMSFCAEEGTSYYIPFGHKVDEPQLTKNQVVAAVKPLLENPKIGKYLHHVKFDYLVLYSLGIQMQGVVFDTMIAAHLLIKDWQRAGLKQLSVQHFDEPMLTYEQVVKMQRLKNFSYVPLKAATLYAAADAHQTFKLYNVLHKELKKEKLEKLYTTIEFPLIDVLCRMEIAGIYVDSAVLQALDKKVTKELTRVIKKIEQETGVADINLNSPKQIEELLFTTLGLPPQKKSSKGAYSTDQEVLEVLAKMHPVPGMISTYRELFKLKSTYIDALPTYINPKTKRVHTTFSQSRVATGRLSSSEPNLQNIPTDGTGYGIEIRAAFKPVAGSVFLSADYSQIELRVLAQLSGDKNLINAFLAGHDIHAETAARLFQVSLDEVSHEQRQIGKRINFSILYGLTPYGLSKDLGIPFADAKKYIERYFEQYPGVSKWMEEVIKETKKHGFVTTHWGRRRYIPGIYEENKPLYDLARRVAINTKAQGTAAEVMKLGMINLEQALNEKSFGARMLLQIHDELLISVPKAELSATEQLAKNVLEGIVDWKIPLVATTRSGVDWKSVTK